MNCEKIKQMIEAYISDAQVSVESADNVHYAAVVISQQFENLNPVKRQQLVYAALGSHIHDGDIHALTLKTLTPAQWSAHE